MEEKRIYNYYNAVHNEHGKVQTVNVNGNVSAEVLMQLTHAFFRDEPVEVKGEEVKCEEVEKAEEPSRKRAPMDEELFHFVHPAMDEEQGRLIHEEVKRLVARQGVQEICQYLMKMREENRILLPLGPDVAYRELVRMGMPNKDGFNIKTFQKYYKNK